MPSLCGLVGSVVPVVAIVACIKLMMMLMSAELPVACSGTGLAAGPDDWPCTLPSVALTPASTSPPHTCLSGGCSEPRPWGRGGGHHAPRSCGVHRAGFLHVARLVLLPQQGLLLHPGGLKWLQGAGARPFPQLRWVRGSCRGKTLRRSPHPTGFVEDCCEEKGQGGSLMSPGATF